MSEKYNKSLFLPKISYNEIVSGKRVFHREVNGNWLGSFQRIVQISKHKSEAWFVSDYVSKIEIEFSIGDKIYLRKDYYDQFKKGDLVLLVTNIKCFNSENICPKELYKDAIFQPKIVHQMYAENFKIDVKDDFFWSYRELTNRNDKRIIQYHFDIVK